MARIVSIDTWLIVAGAFALGIAICANAKPLGERLGVLAKPDGERRRHAGAVPQVGGIAILVPLIVWSGAMLIGGAALDTRLLMTVLLCAAGVGLVGFADDQSQTSPLARMLSLIVFMAVAFILEPDFIASRLHWGSFAPTPIPLWAYDLLMAVTAVGLVNAVNMADGQDGVVGSMFVIWAGCLLLVTHGTSALIAAVLFGASLIFLAFNLGGKLFLGDAGSYGVTFVFGLLVTLAHAKGEVSLETIIVWFFVPVADCLRLVISRPLRGRSPLCGDRDHFHHRLEDKLGKHLGLLSYASIVGSASLVATIAPWFSLVCLAVLTSIYFSFAGITSFEAAASDERDGKDDLAVAEPAQILAFGGQGRGDSRVRESL